MPSNKVLKLNLFCDCLFQFLPCQNRKALLCDFGQGERLSFLDLCDRQLDFAYEDNKQQVQFHIKFVFFPLSMLSHCYQCLI